MTTPRKNETTDHNSPDEVLLDSEMDSIPDPKAMTRNLFSARMLVSLLVAIGVLVFVIRGTDLDVREALRQIRQANVGYFALAVLTYYFSFLLRGYRWKQMLVTAGISESTGHRMPGLGGMFQIITLSWFVNSVLPARAGDAYRCYLIKQRAGASFGISLGTMLAERLIDLVVLVTLLLVSGVVVYGTHAPDRAEQAFLIGGGVVVLGVVGVIVLWFLRDRLESFMPTKAVRHYRRVQSGLFSSLSKPVMPVGISVIIWLCDGLRVFLVAWSLGQHVPYQAAIMVALLSAMISTIPVTPAGLGFVEGIMIYALTTINVSSNTAGAIALLDRVVTYGSLLIVGGIMYAWLLKREVQETNANPG